MRRPRTSTSPTNGATPLPSRILTFVNRVSLSAIEFSLRRRGGRARRICVAQLVRTRRRCAMEYPVLHDSQDALAVLKDADIGQRIAVDKQQIGERSFFDPTDLPGEVHYGGGPRGRPHD